MRVALSQPPVVVLGMHRSGTSAVTRAIGLLGVPLGAADQLQGEWENSALLAIDERILRRLGGAWGAPPELPPGWPDLPAVTALAGEARAALTAAFGDSAFVWKDPRACLTLPFWLPLFARDPVVVVVVRNPLEVAASLERRDRFAPERSLALWEVYLRCALLHGEGLPVLVVRYSELLADPDAGCRALRDGLRDLGVPFDERDTGDAVASLERDRRHHEADPDAPRRHLSPEQSALWELASSMGGVHAEFRCPPLPPLTPASVELLDALRWDKQAARRRSRPRREAGLRLRKQRRGLRALLRRLGLVRGPQRARTMLRRDPPV